VKEFRAKVFHVNEALSAITKFKNA